MVILGLILLLLAAALGFLAWYGLPTADTQISWDILGNHLTISPTTVFFLGAGTMLVLLLGLWLLLAGTKRSARKARELRELKKTQKQAAKADASRARLDAEHSNTYPSTSPTTSHDHGATASGQGDAGADRRY